MTIQEPRETAPSPAPPVDPNLASVRRDTMGSLLCAIVFFGSLGSAVALFFGLKALCVRGEIPTKWRAFALAGALAGFAGLAMFVRLLLDSP